MGVFLGHEIIQTRAYKDPNTKPNNQDYKDTFPITVFDAVRAEMEDENSITLREVLEYVDRELKKRQMRIPNKPANYLVTYAGTEGAVGSIGISSSIPWDTSKQRNDMIPTEKAIGDLLLKLGYIDSDGNVVDSDRRVMWNDIIGRPHSYDELGDNDDGFVNQKALTQIFKTVSDTISQLGDTISGDIKAINDDINAHVNDTNNPHSVTAKQIGALTVDEFEEHTGAYNPHHITAHTVGLGNVDNTSDADKPVSIATQKALDALSTLITQIGSGTTDIKIVSLADVNYDQKTYKLVLTMSDDTQLSTVIPINDLVRSISIDKSNGYLIIKRVNGSTDNVPIGSALFQLGGSEGSVINVSIDETTDGKKSIKANIRPGSITADMLDPNVRLDGFGLTPKCILNEHLNDKAVTTDKIDDGAITTEKINDRAVTGNKIFTAPVDNMILSVMRAGTPPRWTKVSQGMIDIGAVKGTNLEDGAVYTEKIKDGAVTNDKVADTSISGSKLVINPAFNGTPTISVTPPTDSDNHQVPDTHWVCQKLDGYVFKSKNVGNRIIRGNHLFSSAIGNQILAVLGPGTDPKWVKITGDLIDDGGVTGKNIADKTIEGKNIKNGAIGSDQIFTSDTADRVLGVTTKNGHPVYTRVTSKMLDDGAVDDHAVKDDSISPSKMNATDDNVVLGVRSRKEGAKWTQIISKMIADRSVLPQHLFTTDTAHRILGVNAANANPEWTQVSTDMVADKAIVQDHIGDKQIVRRHLNDGIIGNEHLVDRSITGDKIAPRAITSAELFSSPYADMVLAVPDLPYGRPQWTRVTGEMLADKSVTADKLANADAPYSVLGSTLPGKAPSYMKIDSRFITPGGITGKNLTKDIAIPGTPTIEQSPDPTADNNQIPDTHWVRNLLGISESGGTAVIPDHSIDGKKLFTSDTPGVIGVINPGEDAKFTLVGEELIKDKSVTSDKLSDDIILNGLAQINRRPDASASDVAGTGTLIPDCQWVLDRIKAAIDELDYSPGNPGTPGVTPDPGDGDDVWDDYDEWIEIRDTTINFEWADKASGSVDSDDPDEIHSDVVRTEWENGGSGDLTADENELTDAQVKAIWDNPDSGSGTIISGDWIEMAAASVDSIWDQNGEGDLTPDANEITPEEVKAEWDSGGTGSTDHDDYELSKETVDLEWYNGGSGDLETDPNPGPFPGESGGSTTPEVPTYPSTGVATSLKGDGIVHNEHLADRCVNGKKLFTSLTTGVLAVTTPAEDPEWVKVDTDLIADGAITEEKIDPDLLEKLKAGSSTGGDVTTIITPGSVGNDALQEDSVDDSKIADHSITGRKLARKTQIPAYTTVEPQKDCEKKSIRNVIISPNGPTNGSNGDIWMRYY